MRFLWKLEQKGYFKDIIHEYTSSQNDAFEGWLKIGLERPIFDIWFFGVTTLQMYIFHYRSLFFE